jgi:hypothetical protein
MLKSFANWMTFDAAPFLLPVLLLVLPFAGSSHAAGQGPVGVWPASARYSLAADTSLPGLVLIDLQTGSAVERLVMQNARPIAVASCPDCDFALITGGMADEGSPWNFWLLHFSGKIGELLRTNGRLGLDSARLEPLDVRTTAGKVRDGRMVVMSDDGKTAFLAASKDDAVLRVDFSKSPNAKVLIGKQKMTPFGINWDSNGALLVSMHKQFVWRMTVDGKVLAVYDTKAAGCPGTRELKPNLRAAIDDPGKKDSLFILASNPKTYDAVVWRLSVDPQGKQTCSAVAGKIGRDSGWIDAAGEAIVFSRPHHFALRPDTQPPQVVISDIDNRALRVLDLTTFATSTVMYNRDIVTADLPANQRLSRRSCADLKWPLPAAATPADVAQFCLAPPAAEGLVMPLKQAAAHCSTAGARLCEPSELLSSRVESGTRTWTAAECASCWHRKEGARCAASIENYKSPGMVHSDAAFSHSWQSGQALVVGPSEAGLGTTLCRPVEESSQAAVRCCADVTPYGGAGDE